MQEIDKLFVGSDGSKVGNLNYVGFITKEIFIQLVE